MVEIEIGVLQGQCLDRRIDERERLEREIAAWERHRNAAGARVKWMFTTEKARAKMGRAYPRPSLLPTRPPNSHNHCAEELGAGRRRMRRACPTGGQHAAERRAQAVPAPAT